MQFLCNHLHNSLSKRYKEIEVSSVALKKTFVISLKFRIDRRHAISHQLKEVELDYAFFDGFYLDNSFRQKDYFSDFSLKYLSHGSLSCAYSHLKLLEQISSNKDDGCFIVFEDDVLLSKEFDSRLHDLLRNYPIDADLFFLGSRNERKRDYKYRCRFGYNKTYNARLGAYAYVIKASGAKKITEFIKPLNLICGGIDTAIGKLIRQNKIIAYQFDQSIVLHDYDSLSNIYNPSAKTKKNHPSTNTKWPQTVIPS